MKFRTSPDVQGTPLNSEWCYVLRVKYYAQPWCENPKTWRVAVYLAKQEKPGWGAVLFMLSTGEEKDLKVVRKWMNGIETIGAMNWEKGFKGHGLCEYYRRTADQKVFPVIKKMTDELKGNMYRGSWSGRGGPAHFGYGPLHAAGAPCATFLVMARRIHRKALW